MKRNLCLRYASTKHLRYWAGYARNGLKLPEGFANRNCPGNSDCSTKAESKAQSKLHEQFTSRIEFYKSNIGPGAYELPRSLSQRKLAYSFSKEPKLAFKANGIPGVGKYSPKPIVNSTPNYTISKSSKSKEYWQLKRNQRSPGPVYSLPSRTANEHRAVPLPSP